jgi:hypothetical protein
VIARPPSAAPAEIVPRGRDAYRQTRPPLLAKTGGERNRVGTRDDDRNRSEATHARPAGDRLKPPVRG